MPKKSTPADAGRNPFRDVEAELSLWFLAYLRSEAREGIDQADTVAFLRRHAPRVLAADVRRNITAVVNRSIDQAVAEIRAKPARRRRRPAS